MLNSKKSSKLITLVLLTSLLLLAAAINSVNAQGSATVTIGTPTGGTVTPEAGTTTYADGTSVTLTATPDSMFVFNEWIIITGSGATTVTSTDNPFTFTVVGGTNYFVQAVFNPILVAPGNNTNVTPTELQSAAIVVVLSSAGGTTTPRPGTYALANATSFDLTAKPDSGWQFDHWVISGPNLSHGGYPFTATPTDNPYNVNHGYGNMYSYQAVFSPVGSTSPSPTVPEVSGAAALGIIAALACVAVGTYAYKRKK